MLRGGRRALGVVLVGVCALSAAAPVFADDASVRRAWDSEDRRFAVLDASTGRALATWQRRGMRRAGALTRLLARSDRLAVVVARRVAREEASSPAGRRGKAAVLRSLAAYRSSLRLTRACVRAAVAGRMGQARASARRAAAAQRAAFRHAAAAQAAFAEAPDPAPASAPAQKEPASSAPPPAPSSEAPPTEPEQPFPLNLIPSATR